MMIFKLPPLSILLLLVTTGTGISAELAPGETIHPLAIHMKHWISGSGKWRAENHAYDPSAEPGSAGWIKAYGVNWAWGRNRQHMIGEIIAVTADGKELSSSTLYAFYNPVTEKVINLQISRNGILEMGEESVRQKATHYGQPEVGEVLEYFPTGRVSILRHANVFIDPATQKSDVFHKDETGAWKKVATWQWLRVPVVQPEP